MKVFFFLVFFYAVCIGGCESSEVNLTAGVFRSIWMHCGDYYQFTLRNISADTQFIIFQAHSQRQNINVSLTRVWTLGSSKNGRDVGVISFTNFRENEKSFYVWLNCHDNSTSTAVHFAALTYDYQAPVPGACNLEFSLENDSNILLPYNIYKTDIMFAQANTAADRRKHRSRPACGNATVLPLLQYHVYQYYMTEQDLGDQEFSLSLQKMSTVESIRSHGTLLKTLKYPQKTKLSIASRPGQGAVYGVIVEQTGGATAAYVPAASYACQFDSKVDNCFGLISATTDVFCTIGGILGIFLCFVGHRFFKTEMFLFGFMATALIVFILVARFTAWNGTVQLVMTLLIGALGGGLWLMFWCFTGIPVVAVLLVGMVLGYLITSVVFNTTPVGNMDIWSTPFNYGMVFACGVLVVPMVLLAFTKVLNIVSCAVVGSFAAMVTIDVYAHTNFSFIVINSIKKAIIPGFTNGLVTMPFQIGDILLCTGWAVLTIVGCIVQFYRERKKPPFPPCPYQTYKLRREHRLTMDRPTTPSAPTEPAGRDTDPLLPHRHDLYEGQQPMYQGHGSNDVQVDSKKV